MADPTTTPVAISTALPTGARAEPAGAATGACGPLRGPNCAPRQSGA
jgi:hypothetical protein